jgi:glycosyltransferase involved in cell wall biosynthesis
MKLSVVVIVYNMKREAPRTLSSLSVPYQQGIAPEDYEVIVVENGSSDRLDPAAVKRFGPNFQYHYIEKASPSPAGALNFGIAKARGEVVGIMIDGARICSPGLLGSALAASKCYPRTVVATMGFYLGPGGFQRDNIQKGYDQKQEDRLLNSIDWPSDGYRLFEISSADESSRFFAQLSESNALFLRRELWTELGGVDEKFDMPGGGLVNLDTYTRACELPGTELVSLLGEATFHQVHGGVATNSSMDVFEPRFKAWMEQYRQLRGRTWDLVPKRRRYFGSTPRPVWDHLIWELHELDPPPFVAERREFEANMDRLQGRIDFLEAELRDTRQERDRMRSELDLLTGSHSWYLTRPLRSAFRGISALKGRMGRGGNGSGNGAP